MAQEYQIHYEFQLIDQHQSFQMYRSKYFPFATTHGTFVLNHIDTIQLIDPVSQHSKTLPGDQLHSCQATRDAYYCDQGIMEHDQGHECINALQAGNAGHFVTLHTSPGQKSQSISPPHGLHDLL